MIFNELDLLRSILEPFALAREDAPYNVEALKRNAMALIRVVDEARRASTPELEDLQTKARAAVDAFYAIHVNYCDEDGCSLCKAAAGLARLVCRGGWTPTDRQSLDASMVDRTGILPLLRAASEVREGPIADAFSAMHPGWQLLARAGCGIDAAAAALAMARCVHEPAASLRPIWVNHDAEVCRHCRCVYVPTRAAQEGNL